MDRAYAELDEGRAPPTPALPGDFAPEMPDPDGPAGGEQSLLHDVEALVGDAKTYLEAEVAYQKSRAGFAANRLKLTAFYGAAAFGLLHLAGIALTVGAIIALAPLVGPWIATGVVVVALLLGALFFLLRLRGKFADIRSLFEDDGA